MQNSIQNLNEKFHAEYLIKKEMYEEIILVYLTAGMIHNSNIGFKHGNNGEGEDGVSRPHPQPT